MSRSQLACGRKDSN